MVVVEGVAKGVGVTVVSMEVVRVGDKVVEAMAVEAKAVENLKGSLTRIVIVSSLQPMLLW